MNNLKITDFGHMNEKKNLSIHVQTTDRMFFNKSVKSEIRAKVCGNCGFVELAVNNPQELWPLIYNKRARDCSMSSSVKRYINNRTSRTKIYILNISASIAPHLVAFICLMFLAGCAPKEEKFKPSQEKNEIEFIEIKFPKFEQWIECYDDPQVQRYFDDMTDSDHLKINGVYLSTSDYSNKNNLDDIEIEDYAVFTQYDRDQKWKIKGTELKGIFNAQKKDVGVKSYSKYTALRKIYTDSTFVSSTLPIVIEEYQPHPDIYSAVKLIKRYEDEHDLFRVYVFNLMVVKNHLMYSTYYLTLNGNESIKKVKRMNDVMMKRFIQHNQ